MLKDLPLPSAPERIGRFINAVLSMDKKWSDRHYDYKYKNYVYDLLTPLPSDRVYKAFTLYSLRFRTPDPDVSLIFEKYADNFTDDFFKIVFIKKSVKNYTGKIDSLFSITPLLIRNDSGYWMNKLTFKDYEERLTGNLNKKYNDLYGTSLRNHRFYSTVSFKNGNPLKILYKGRCFLGDKLKITVNSDEVSQKMASMALGCGMGDNNSTLGTGFMDSELIRDF